MDEFKAAWIKAGWIALSSAGVASAITLLLQGLRG